MRRYLLAAIVILLSAVRGPAAVVLDQEHNVATAIADSTNGAVSEVAQTFTVGIAGTLDHFEISMLQLGGIFTTTGDPQLSVYNTAGGVPTGTALATVQIPSAQVPLGTTGFVPFDVSASAIPVTVGEVLAFGIFTASDPGPYFLPYDNDTGAPDDYTAGAAYRRTRPANPWQLLQPFGDHEFRTFVNVGAGPILGDWNRDGERTAADIPVMLQALANLAAYQVSYSVSDDLLVQLGDTNQDDLVNNSDIQSELNLLIHPPTAPTPALSPVPEPSSLLLIALGSALFSCYFTESQSPQRAAKCRSGVPSA